jgi:hypothetical protein
MNEAEMFILYPDHNRCIARKGWAGERASVSTHPGYAQSKPGLILPQASDGLERLVRVRTSAGSCRAYPSTIERRAGGNDHDHRKTHRRQFCSVVSCHRNLGAESWRIRSCRLIIAFSGFVQLVRLAAGHHAGGFFMARFEAS